MQQVLKGVKVIDFTMAVSAPVCTKMLHCFGADVITVEALTGNTTRFGDNHSFDFLSNGKKNIAVDLKTDEGKEIMLQLVAQADVFVANFRAKALKKLGLSYEDLKAVNPGLIYAVVDGYGNVGPMKDDPGYDVICFWARAGLQRDMSPAEMLMPTPVSVGDTATGISLTAAVCAALYNKKVTGEGTYVTSSILSTGIFLNNDCFMEAQFGSRFPKSHSTARRALMNSYRCKDGEWLSILTIKFDRDFNNLLRAVGREDLIGDPRWTCIEDTMEEHAPELIAILDDAFSKMTRDEAIARIRPIDIGLSPVMSTLDTIDDAQVQANRFVLDYTYETGEHTWVPAIPCRIGADYEPEPVQRGPRLGQDTVAILRSLGYEQAQIERLIEKNIIGIPAKT